MQFLKNILKSVGINRKNLERISVSLYYVWLKAFCVIPGGKMIHGLILTESALLLEKRKITLPQFDTILHLYFKK